MTPKAQARILRGLRNIARDSQAAYTCNLSDRDRAHVEYWVHVERCANLAIEAEYNLALYHHLDELYLAPIHRVSQHKRTPTIKGLLSAANNCTRIIEDSIQLAEYAPEWTPEYLASHLKPCEGFEQVCDGVWDYTIYDPNNPDHALRVTRFFEYMNASRVMTMDELDPGEMERTCLRTLRVYKALLKVEQG